MNIFRIRLANRHCCTHTLLCNIRFMDEAATRAKIQRRNWSKQHDFVASTIVGATNADQMDDILAAADVTISPEANKRIDAVSQQYRYPMG